MERRLRSPCRATPRTWKAIRPGSRWRGFRARAIFPSRGRASRLPAPPDVLPVQALLLNLGSHPDGSHALDTSTMSPHVRRLLWVRGLRAFGDGFVSLLLPLYLIELGLGPFEVGAITAGTLLGSGVLTLAIGLSAHRFRLRTLLLCATVMMAATG